MVDDVLQAPAGRDRRLSRDEIRFLASLARRAYSAVIRRRKPFSLLSPDKRSRTPRQLRIAALAFQFPDLEKYITDQPPQSAAVFKRLRHPYSHIVIDGPVGEQLSTYILHRTKSFLEKCREHRRQPGFVLINELALCFENRAELEAEWQQLANSFNCCIVPGTYHCTESNFAVAPIFHVQNRRAEEALKQNSARRQEENIRTPDSRSIQIFLTDFGNLIVWICLDLYDPGLVLKFLSLTNRLAERRGVEAVPRHNIDLVLIPSFNDDDPENIKRAVEMLSRFSNIPIVCSNSYSDPEKGIKRLETTAYFGKDEAKDLARRALGWRQDGRSRCSLFEFDAEKLREQSGQLAPPTPLPYSPVFAEIITGESVRDVDP